MTRYGMVVDITRCNGCYNCFMACRDEYCGNEFPPYSASQPKTGHYWMRLVEKERGQYPKMKVAYTAIPCMQCDRPQCVEVAAAGSAPDAIYRREDGIVIIDPEKAAGHKELAEQLPLPGDLLERREEAPAKMHVLRASARPGLEGAALRGGVPYPRAASSATSTIRRARWRDWWPRVRPRRCVRSTAWRTR